WRTCSLSAHRHMKSSLSLCTSGLLAFAFCELTNALHGSTPQTAKEAAGRARQAAKGSYEVMDQSLYRNASAFLPAFRWSKRWMDAETWIDPGGRLGAAKAHYARARTLHKIAEDNPAFALDSADYYLAEAEDLARQAGALTEKSSDEALGRRAD